MYNWYDPITERWYKMPTYEHKVHIIEPEEDVYARANRLNRQRDIWDALQDVCNI